MPTITLGTGVPAWNAKEVGKVLDITIDFSATNRALGDILKSITPANTYITDVFYQVVTASTDASTRTVDIGDNGSATQWVSNLDMKTKADMVRSSGSAELYTAADAINIHLDTDLTTGVLRVVAYGEIIG